MFTMSEKIAILQKHQHSVPVSVTPIARELGLKVFYATWDNPSISGMIRKDKDEGKSGFSIYVNKDHHSNRQRFTIAHEIARYVLHENEIDDEIVDDALYRSGLSNKLEIAAKNLAADILIPWDLLKESMVDPGCSISKLAEQFRVSKSCMSIRLRVPHETDE